jgi:glutamine amidotransferase
MFGYAGKSEKDIHALYAGLKGSCANDPTLKAVAAGCSRHCHGWGYVIQADNGLFHYRSARPIYDDHITLPKLEGEIRAIFHGRYASNENLLGHIFSHPFVASTNKEVIFLAHNGGVSVPPEKLSDRTVDSEWVLDQIVLGGTTDATLVKLKESTKSALNLLVLTVNRSVGTPVSLQYFHYFKFKESDKAAYYKMYTGSMPNGVALVSSTLTMDNTKVEGLSNVAPAKYDILTPLNA